MWKLGYGDWSWWPCDMCYSDDFEHPDAGLMPGYDYCAKFEPRSKFEEVSDG
jgi:hypothetical protein